MTPPTNEETVINAALMMLSNNIDASTVEQFLRTHGLKHIVHEGKIIDQKDKTEPWLDRFITQHPTMLQLKDDIRKLAKVDHEVLITGETGTGKEIVAHALHGKREGDFKALNCAGLPETLIESELFGHLKGSYTDAYKDKVGLIMAAKNGTLFLDEIGEFPLQAQAKLLRVLQEKRIRPVGSNEFKDVTCRFVFATNRDLRVMCKEGTFRLDLYARISTFELHTLPLSERMDDIKPIILSMQGGKEFIDVMLLTYNKEWLTYLSDISLNVRSLERYVKRFNVLGRV